mgnify:CR=1 FL=1
MIVITLSKTPASLRGDLTKWCQEIQTGIYVGSVNAKVRDLLWERVQKNIGQGEATLVYNTNNELGYTFRTTRLDRKIVDFDGIPLLKHVNVTPNLKLGFSNAAKYHKAKVCSRSVLHNSTLLKFAVIDIETTGLAPNKSEILSIGAVKYLKNGKVDVFYKLIRDVNCIPADVSELTGLNMKILKSKGSNLIEVLKMLKDLKIEDVEKVFLDNYKLSTVLSEYKIENQNPHHADFDAKCTYQLALKLINEGKLKL